MPQRKSLVTVIRDMVREQVQEAVQGLLAVSVKWWKISEGIIRYG